MSESQPTRSPASPEADLVKRINETYAHIERATRETVPRAIELGAMLIKAKADYGTHGDWGQWLKTNCKQLSERTAQLYMKLAEGRPKIEVELAKRSDPATVADLISELSLRGALQLIKGNGSGGNGSGNPSDAYDKAKERLIVKLKALPFDEAEAAVAETTTELQSAVAEIAKEERKAATKKAA